MTTSTNNTAFVPGMSIIFSAETVKAYARGMHKLLQSSEIRQALGCVESDKMALVMEMLAQGDFKSAVAEAEQTKHIQINTLGYSISINVSQELMTVYAETSVKAMDVAIAVVSALNAIKSIIRFSGIKEQFAKLKEMANEKLNPEKEEAKPAKRGTPVKKGQPSNLPVTGSAPARKVPAKNA